MSTQSPPGGSIIGISSISALVGGAQQAHYTPTKAGVLSLMQSCACALGTFNIRCNALLPGTIKTQLNEKDLEDETKRKYMEGRIPLGRTGVPKDLAGPAIFLGSEELSGYVVSVFCICVGVLVVLTMCPRLVRSCWSTAGCLLICSNWNLNSAYQRLFLHVFIQLL
jgi:L-rhamnose 1-dehydrogenase